MLFHDNNRFKLTQQVDYCHNVQFKWMICYLKVAANRFTGVRTHPLVPVVDLVLIHKWGVCNESTQSKVSCVK